jgi:hypothetical protein
MVFSLAQMPAIPHPSRRKLAAATVIALLLHYLLLEYSQRLWLTGSTPPPVTIHEVDANKLEQVRQQWRARELLLSKDRETPPSVKPRDARYISDRNRVVPEERRARQTAPMPQKAQNPSAAHRPLPNLAQLGVRLPRPAATAGAAQIAQDQALHDRNLKEGDENLLNTVESVYYSYYARLYQAIAPLWNSRIRQAAVMTRGIPNGEYISRADVVFDSEGNLKAVRLLQSSGIPAFDEAIPYAWQRIERFP